MRFKFYILLLNGLSNFLFCIMTHDKYLARGNISFKPLIDAAPIIIIIINQLILGSKGQ